MAILTLAQVASTAMRVCRDCGTEKPLEGFSKNKSGGFGRRTYCKPCGVQRTAVWQRENPEQKNANALRYFYRHHAECLAAGRKYKRENREKERTYQKAYRKAHPDTTVRLWRKRWKERHPELVAELARVRAKRRYARKKGARGNITPEQLRQRVLFYGGLCWLCKAVRNEMDHIKPIAKGGVHLPCNIRPICGKCNRVKSDLWPFLNKAAFHAHS